MESANESNPPQLPLPPSPPSMSLLKLLPVDIVLSTLARIPTSYYPTLCLVSKRFRSLIISEELGMLRLYLGTREACMSAYNRAPILVIVDGSRQAYRKFSFTSAIVLFSSLANMLYETVGSETYEIGGQNCWVPPRWREPSGHET
ncbi:BnaCnng56500D [Brassica napus]|uniref:(rape) hypothetical protein n=1 Tax=Brassica napus TaxID=3708 RepID=A0A078JLY7_BRANA|nr:unnamed protein product [Brassica napus]CDY67809.1 BnaCnng56500D [Brassica napus]